MNAIELQAAGILVPCISMWQPYASLLVRGRKANETRPRPLNAKYLNKWVYIAASLKPLVGRYLDEMSERLREICDDEFGCSWNYTLERGCLVGRVKFDTCVSTYGAADFETADEIAMGNWGRGRSAWRVHEHEEFKLRWPVKGLQSLPFHIPQPPDLMNAMTPPTAPARPTISTP